MEYGDDGGYAVNPFEPECEIHQHPRERVKRRPSSLFAELRPNLRSDDLNASNAKLRGESAILESGDNFGLHSSTEFIDGTQYSAAILVAKIGDLPGDLRVTRRSVTPKMKRIFAQQVLGNLRRARIVEVELSRRLRTEVFFHGADDFGPALVERLLAGLLLRETDDPFVVGGCAQPLNLHVAIAGLFHGLPDF